MIKLIFKNIWSRRKLNGWLIAELILVTILSWLMLDQVLVTTYDLNLPKGYDRDNLCVISSYNLDDPGVVNSIHGEITPQDYENIRNKLLTLPEVESIAECSFTFPESLGNSTRSFYVNDEKSLHVYLMYYYADTGFFETLGVKSAEGYPNVEDLSKVHTAENEVIITRSFAESLFPGENAMGKIIRQEKDSDEDAFKVVGVIEDIRPHSINREPNAVFCSLDSKINGEGLLNFIVRLKDGIDADDFAENLIKVKENFGSGALQIGSAKSLNKSAADWNMYITGEYNLKLSLLTFFLINLCIGVVGTFWLQTRQRKGEVAVMKTFGASRKNIVGMLLGEGFVLTIIGSIIGFACFLQYAISEGLYTSNPYVPKDVSGVIDCWVNNFSEHFMIVSGVILVLLLIVVSIGILIPALNISKINPAVALHDE
ncbi:MAG: ABC transporter permease [Muribaculaceae bacterium]